MIRRGPFLLLLAALLVGCASAFLSLPPIARSDQQLAGKVVWRELLTPNLAAAQHFYGGVFGWQFEPVGDDYALVRHDGRVIGGMALVEASAGSQWIPQFSVPDVARATSVAKAAGGTILAGPVSVGGRGDVALIRDPQAAVFGVINAATGDPPDVPPQDGDWLWQEAWVNDPAAVSGFYRQVIGFLERTQSVSGKPYLYLKSVGVARAGVVRKPDPTVGDAWLSYVRVADVHAVVDRVAALGGRVLFAPTADVRRGSLAIIADPGGAGLAVQQWPLKSEGEPN